MAVDVVGFGITAAHEAGVPFAIAVAHDHAAAEQLRHSGADTIVADLQELLAPTS